MEFFLGTDFKRLINKLEGLIKDKENEEIDQVQSDDFFLETTFLSFHLSTSLIDYK